ncbi:MAG: tRNA uridine-5-carboxymethylaminomethyl(34) synthesis GTPase MnmE [Rhodobacteraceae bacterium]|nr:MAG: tRNA uridine-5-carboxymethylaminomethyl(34) synthesis GTPase MnmE [Paracoccaceae bacterium]
MSASDIDTIFALATAPGRGAIAIIRVSGPDCAAIAERLAGGFAFDRRMRLRALRDPATGETLDSALVVGFPEGASFTGEAMTELHLHGGRAVAAAVMRALAALGAQPAAPGAFSRRAFDNGRLDLLEAEGVAQLAAAETEAQRRLALWSLGGAASATVAAWRETLVEALVWFEADSDFGEEELGGGVAAPGYARVRELVALLDAARAKGDAAARIREGARVAIIGPPNVGKSSLINALVKRDIAITSPIAGTTRDALEARCEAFGFDLTLVDTAGLRVTDDPIEAVGVARAQAAAETADLRVFVSSPEATADLTTRRSSDLHVANKADLGCIGEDADFTVSAVTGEGLDALLDAIGARIVDAGAAQGAFSTARHLAALDGARAALARAAQAPPEIAAEECRLAAQALDSLIGRVDVEHILDGVFSTFCLGK